MKLTEFIDLLDHPTWFDEQRGFTKVNGLAFGGWLPMDVDPTGASSTLVCTPFDKLNGRRHVSIYLKVSGDQPRELVRSIVRWRSEPGAGNVTVLEVLAWPPADWDDWGPVNLRRPTLPEAPVPPAPSPSAPARR
jgi:hypothetical protein